MLVCHSTSTGVAPRDGNDPPYRLSKSRVLPLDDLGIMVPTPRVKLGFALSESAVMFGSLRRDGRGPRNRTGATCSQSTHDTISPVPDGAVGEARTRCLPHTKQTFNHMNFNGVGRTTGLEPANSDLEDRRAFHRRFARVGRSVRVELTISRLGNARQFRSDFDRVV